MELNTISNFRNLFFLHCKSGPSFPSYALADDDAAGETVIQVENEAYTPPENAEHYKFEAEVSRVS